MKLKSHLPVFLPAGLFLFLSLFASSCYWAKSLPGEAYRGHHVYLVKTLAACCEYDYTEKQQPSDYLKKTDTLYAYDRDFIPFYPYDLSDEKYQAWLKKWENLSSQGYSVGGETYRMIWQDEWRKGISFALPPGSLFRVTHFWWNGETGTKIYADVLNGPMAGKKIEVGSLGTHFCYPSGLDDLFEYPAGRTQPFWLEEEETYVVLDPDVVQDLGELTDAELKEKGLWLEPGSEAAKALVKPLPEGIDLDRLREDAENNDIDAQVQLGKLYYEGAGVGRDSLLAEHWFQRAIDQGSGEAEFRRAIMHAGRIFGRDQKVEEIFRKNAEQGDHEAQFCLALLLDYKKGADGQREAVEWYRKVADQGDARAQRALGMAYATGRGVKQDYELAAEWFKKSAELGDFAAQRNLGYLYLHGKGVKKDKAEARNWLEKAAAQGDIYAAELLKEIE